MHGRLEVRRVGGLRWRRGHFQVPTGSEGWEEAINLPSCVAYVAKGDVCGPLILVKWALAFRSFYGILGIGYRLREGCGE